MSEPGCRVKSMHSLFTRMVGSFPCPFEPLPATCKELLSYYDSLKKNGLPIDIGAMSLKPPVPAIKRRAESLTTIVIERPQATFCLARDSIDLGPVSL